MKTGLIAGALAVFIVITFGFAGKASAINFNGYVQNSSGTPLSDITVYQAENPATASSPSAADGSFTVPGLPSGTDFSLHMVDTSGSATYADGYTRTYNRTIDATGTAFTFTVFTPAEIANWYANTVPLVSQNANGGSIRGRAKDLDSLNNVGGVHIGYTSTLGRTYPVRYYNGTTGKYVTGQATFANGLYMILNVADGDTVTVTASKAGWEFTPMTFSTHSGTLNVSVGNLYGKELAVYLPLILR